MEIFFFGGQQYVLQGPQTDASPVGSDAGVRALLKTPPFLALPFLSVRPTPLMRQNPFRRE
jgi:hypothetical protein